MSQQTLPWIEGAYGWNFGESGWNSGMDTNLIKFSFLFDRNVDSIVAALPSAINGQAHYLTTDNRLYFAVGTTYFSTIVPKWFTIVVRSDGTTWQYNGTALTQIDNITTLSDRLDAVELTIASLGSAAFEDVTAFATTSELDIVEAQAQSYTDVLRSDLVSSVSEIVGSGMVAHDPFLEYAEGTVGAELRILDNLAIPEQYGAVGDGIADDTTAIFDWLASGRLLTLRKNKTYKITAGFKVPNRTVIWGVGESTKFVWAGGNGVSPANKTRVFDVSAVDPSINALSNVILEDLHVDLVDAENVVGFHWEYASVKSRGCGLNVYNLGINSEGFRFTKEWYATFRDLSVRNASVTAGSVAYNLATSTPLGQINRVRMNDLQANRIDVGLLLDTSQNYIYGLYVSGEFELCRIGIQHIGGLGVRQGEFNVYLESNTESDVSWGATPGGPGTDVTGPILWSGCAFHANSKFTIAEGEHEFIGSQQIGTLNQSGGRVHLRGSAGVIKNLTGGTLRHDITVTALANKTVYGSADAYPLIGESAIAVSTTTPLVSVFPVPSVLFSPTLPSAGRSMRISIFGRRNYNPVEKYWEGFVSQKSDASWALTKFSYSSADDAVWTVAIDSVTGSITVTFNAGDQKVIGVTWMPV